MKHTLRTTISIVGYYLNLWRLFYNLYPIVRKKYILTAATFHRVIPEEKAADYLVDYDIGQDSKLYEAILEELSNYFDFIDLESFIKFALGQEKPKNHSMLITFDDADSEFVDYALPILARNKWPTAVFAPTKYIDTDERFWHLRVSNLIKNMDADGWQQIVLAKATFSDQLLKVIDAYPHYSESVRRPICRDIIACLDSYDDEEIISNVERFDALAWRPYTLGIKCMNWNQLKMLGEHNVAVESHSVTHSKFKHLSLDIISAELKESKSIIESMLDKDVRAFCYPAGSYDHDFGKLVEAAGYKVAFTTQSGLCDYPMPSDRMFSIPRISIEGNNRIEINYRIGELLFKRNRINSKLATCVIFGLIAIICIASLFYINNK
jgi:peptidoglycan/xylan/chitin deacetylase (PgdA/CDA1 family)